jgi:formamidopyrimidine-DNA glycosylase
MFFRPSHKKMPEMPEVETLARMLRKTLIGKQVAGVCLSGQPLRRPIDRNFAAHIQGRTIRKIVRRGKYLVAKLEPQAFWLMHLGMSGTVLYHSPAVPPARHTHAIITFSDASELQYRDHRRFGMLAAYEVARLDQIPELMGLGVDPLSPRFDADWLSARLRNSRREIKSFLLDQRRIAGLGNIYACEALCFARIHPARRCFRITSEETAHLVGAIRKVLRLAIRNRGTSFSDFMDSNGKPGGNQGNLRVFQREGEKCFRCPARIQRIRQGNRSSYFCSGCQK